MQTTFSFQCPTFRPNTHIEWEGDAAILRYKSRGCKALLGNNKESQAFINYLADQKPKPLLANFISRYENSVSLLQCVDNLDQLGLLTETVFSLDQQSLTGAQFYREISRYVSTLSEKMGVCAISQSLVQGHIKKTQLIGYLCEYFHIVYRFAETVSPAICRCPNDAVRELILKYFISEMNHHRYIESALATVGITKQELLISEPLSWTFALTASLSANAHQHFISLVCFLHLFEQETEEFYELFKSRCIALQFDEAFYKPILDHAAVNNRFQHADLAKEIFNLIPIVNFEDQVVAKRNVSILLESFHEQSKQLVEYYADPHCLLPRIYERI